MHGACGDNTTEDKEQQQTLVTRQQVSYTWYSSLSGAWGVSWKCFSGYRLFWKSLKQHWDMQQDRWRQWQRCPFGFLSAWSNICSVHRLKARSWRTKWIARFRCKQMPTSRLFCQKDLPNAFSQIHSRWNPTLLVPEMMTLINDLLFLHRHRSGILI